VGRLQRGLALKGCFRDSGIARDYVTVATVSRHFGTTCAYVVFRRYFDRHEFRTGDNCGLASLTRSRLVARRHMELEHARLHALPLSLPSPFFSLDLSSLPPYALLWAHVCSRHGPIRFWTQRRALMRVTYRYRAGTRYHVISAGRAEGLSSFRTL